MRIDSIQLDIERSLTFDQEEWLNGLMESLRTTPEEFARLYVLEVEPFDIQAVDIRDLGSPTQYIFRIEQTYKIRRKTVEEMAAEHRTALTQGDIS